MGGERKLAPLRRQVLYPWSGMSRVNDKVSRGLEVLLRALWCKARGGGGRLRHATEIVKKEKKQEKEVIYT